MKLQWGVWEVMILTLQCLVYSSPRRIVGLLFIWGFRNYIQEAGNLVIPVTPSTYSLVALMPHNKNLSGSNVPNYGVSRVSIPCNWALGP